MSTVIVTLIRSFHGYIYESAGIISGFFSDPDDAQACALKIRSVAGREVDVCGSQLSVAL